MSNPYATKPTNGSGKGSAEDMAVSPYPIPGTNVVVGVDESVESPQRPYGWPIPLGSQPPQRTTLDPQTGTDNDIAGDLPEPFSTGPGSGLVDEFPDAMKMHADTLGALDAGSRRIVAALLYQGAAIIRLDGSAGPVNIGQVGISHLRFRVRVLILSRLTAGVTNLIIGSARYPFNLGTVPAIIDPWPLVIERGTDVSIDGDGNAYLVGIGE